MDEPDDDHYGDHPDYADPEDLTLGDLTTPLCDLHLLGDDPNLRMQAWNLAVVDKFVMELETGMLRLAYGDERDREIPDLMFASAQTQMWVFAAYELLRTWRQRAKDVIKLAKNGALRSRIETLERDDGFVHYGRKYRAEQLRGVLDDPSLIGRIEADLRQVHIPFARMEYLRISLAKHEVAGKRNSVALAPVYGRIDRFCGSLTYEIEINGVVIDRISRREIADSLRALGDRSNPPTDKELKSFDEFMKGPPAGNPFLDDINPQRR